MLYKIDSMIEQKLHLQSQDRTLKVTSKSNLNNTVFIKSARAMWKVLMVQNCDNDILEGLPVVIENFIKKKLRRLY
jgi:hypothetical protein